MLTSPVGSLGMAVSSVYVKSLFDLFLNLRFIGGRLVRHFVWLYVKFHFCRITHVQMCLLLTLPFPNHFQNILLAKCCAEKPKAYNRWIQDLPQLTLLFPPSSLLLLKTEFLSPLLAVKAWTIFKYEQYIWQSRSWPWMTVTFTILESILPPSPLSDELPDY